MFGWQKNEHVSPASEGGPCPQTSTLAALESLAIPLVQEVVFLADFRCARCQQRVAKIMSKMDGVTQSVMISILDKKVTLTYTYPISQPRIATHRMSSMRRFRSSSTT